ncbi:MAG: ABC transporter permease [Syntrophaceae bacterium]|nr:ABC transporter permease [Syntrophaceae bacterium]
MKMNISWRFLRVWQRNLAVYRKNWLINFLLPFLSPLFYLVAFGISFSVFIVNIHYDTNSVSYISFIAPAIIAINIMNNSFFENTYGSFVRMYYQKTFDAMMATPLNAEEIITGEIIWGATKSLISSVIMLFVISFFGVVSYPVALLIIPVAFLGGIAFGAVGMCFTSMVTTIDLFSFPVFLFITPMFLFSGTFFPLTGLPVWAQHVALFLPLTHLVNVVRALNYGLFNQDVVIGICYLIVFSLITVPIALFKMQRRLIK